MNPHQKIEKNFLNWWSTVIRTIGFFVIALTVLPLSAKDFTLKVLTPTVSKDRGGYAIRVKAQTNNSAISAFSESPAVIPNARYRVLGLIPSKNINESNILFGSIRYDINNNGSYNDSYTFHYRKGILFLGRKRASISFTGKRYGNFSLFDYGTKSEPVMMTFSPRKPFFIEEYNQRLAKAVILLPEAQSFTFLSLPNPGVMISVVKQVDSYRDNPMWQIDSPFYVTATNEVYFDDQAGGWVNITWTVKKAAFTSSKKAEVWCRISGITPPFAVTATGIFSISPGITMKSLTRKIVITD
jgi:hypothetical protein